MAKKGFLEGYKTYDPNKEGYGSPAQWREAFFQRLGIDKAVEVLGEQDPLDVLGITVKKPTWEEVLQAFRKKIVEVHPDRNPDNKEAVKMAQNVIAAFEVLEKRYNK